MTDLTPPTKPPSGDDDLVIKVKTRWREKVTVNHVIAAMLAVYLGGKTVCAHIWQGKPPGTDETLSVMRDCSNCMKVAASEMQQQKIAFGILSERREDCADFYGRASQQMTRTDDLLRSMKSTFRRFSDVIYAVEAKYGDKKGDE